MAELTLNPMQLRRLSEVRPPKHHEVRAGFWAWLDYHQGAARQLVWVRAVLQRTAVIAPAPDREEIEDRQLVNLRRLHAHCEGLTMRLKYQVTGLDMGRG